MYFVCNILAEDCLNTWIGMVNLFCLRIQRCLIVEQLRISVQSIQFVVCIYKMNLVRISWFWLIHIEILWKKKKICNTEKISIYHIVQWNSIKMSIWNCAESKTQSTLKFSYTKQHPTRVPSNENITASSALSHLTVLFKALT